MRNEMIKHYFLSVVILTAFGCGIRVGNPDGSKDSDDSTSNNSVEQPMGSISFSLTDAAIDSAAKVFVRIAAIHVKRADSDDWLEIPKEVPDEIDLLTLQDGNTAPLAAISKIGAGVFTHVRLKLSESQPARIVLKDGRQYPLNVPSGSETGLKINQKFEVIEGEDLRLIVDFDLRKSVVVLGQGNGEERYLLKPTLRMIPEALAQVYEVSADGDNGSVVCAYLVEVPFDEEDSCMNSVTSAILRSGAAKLPFLNPGQYKFIVFYSDGSSKDLGVKKVGEAQ